MSEPRSLQDYEKWAASRQNFEFLHKVGVQATDLDLVVHASATGADHFLVMELKEPGVTVPTGQRILLDALGNTTRKKNFTVVVVHGPDENGTHFLSGDWKGSLDTEALADRVSSWWRVAKRGAA